MDDNSDEEPFSYGNLAFSASEKSLKKRLSRTKLKSRSWESTGSSQPERSGEGSKTSDEHLRKRLRELEESISQLREIKRNALSQSQTSCAAQNPKLDKQLQRATGSGPHSVSLSNARATHQSSSYVQFQHSINLSQSSLTIGNAPKLLHNVKNVNSQAHDVVSQQSVGELGSSQFGSQISLKRSQVKQRRVRSFRPPAIMNSSQQSVLSDRTNQPKEKLHATSMQPRIEPKRQGTISRSQRSTIHSSQLHASQHAFSQNSAFSQKSGTKSSQHQARANHTLESYFSSKKAPPALPAGAAVQSFNLVQTGINNVVQPRAETVQVRGQQPLNENSLLSRASELVVRNESTGGPLTQGSCLDDPGSFAPSDCFRQNNQNHGSIPTPKRVSIPGPVGAFYRSHPLAGSSNAGMGTQVFREIVKRVEHNPASLDFVRGPWLTLCLHNRLPPVVPRAVLDNNPVGATTISDLMKGEACKVQYLCAMVTELHYLEMGATASLADPSGTIEAEVSQSVLKSNKFEFLLDSAVVLRNVTLFQPHLKRLGQSSHYLIITLENVDQVFPPQTTLPSESMSKLDRYRTYFQSQSSKSRDQFSLIPEEDEFEGIDSSDEEDQCASQKIVTTSMSERTISFQSNSASQVSVPKMESSKQKNALQNEEQGSVTLVAESQLVHTPLVIQEKRQDRSELTKPPNVPNSLDDVYGSISDSEILNMAAVTEKCSADIPVSKSVALPNYQVQSTKVSDGISKSVAGERFKWSAGSHDTTSLSGRAHTHEPNSLKERASTDNTTELNTKPQTHESNSLKERANTDNTTELNTKSQTHESNSLKERANTDNTTELNTKSQTHESNSLKERANTSNIAELNTSSQTYESSRFKKMPLSHEKKNFEGRNSDTPVSEIPIDEFTVDDLLNLDLDELTSKHAQGPSGKRMQNVECTRNESRTIATVAQQDCDMIIDAKEKLSKLPTKINEANEMEQSKPLEVAIKSAQSVLTCAAKRSEEKGPAFAKPTPSGTMPHSCIQPTSALPREPVLKNSTSIRNPSMDPEQVAMAMANVTVLTPAEASTAQKPETLTENCSASNQPMLTRATHELEKATERKPELQVEPPQSGPIEATDYDDIGWLNM